MGKVTNQVHPALHGQSIGVMWVTHTPTVLSLHKLADQSGHFLLCLLRSLNVSQHLKTELLRMPTGRHEQVEVVDKFFYGSNIVSSCSSDPEII